MPVTSLPEPSEPESIIVSALLENLENVAVKHVTYSLIKDLMLLVRDYSAKTVNHSEEAELKTVSFSTNLAIYSDLGGKVNDYINFVSGWSENRSGASSIAKKSRYRRREQ